jgi:hypothetical protein
MLDMCKVNHENTVALRGVSESRLFTHVAKGDEPPAQNLLENFEAGFSQFHDVAEVAPR